MVQKGVTSERGADVSLLFLVYIFLQFQRFAGYFVGSLRSADQVIAEMSCRVLLSAAV